MLCSILPSTKDWLINQDFEAGRHKRRIEMFKELHKFLSSNEIKIVIYALNNPIEIVKEFNDFLKIEYFNLNNVITPYHFKKSFWNNIYSCLK